MRRKYNQQIQFTNKKKSINIITLGIFHISKFLVSNLKTKHNAIWVTIYNCIIHFKHINERHWYFIYIFI